VHIRSVTAEAFGPLAGETLTFSRGLTVISGDNESAKSSWHAAIYAALCGRRRGKGAPQARDREFAERRRPWDSKGWRVRCEVELDDGRSVTLNHDLDGLVDCRAYDDRGRDLSNEIMYDGSPDGSRWLGLNRRSFAATACVNQAELLRVLEAAGELQKDIQRAAATAGKDETAAAALSALKKFTSEQVGKDTANSKRPLRVALTEFDSATAALTEASRSHGDFLRLAAQTQSAAEQAAEAASARQSAEAAAAAAERLTAAAEALDTATSAAVQAQSLADDRQARATASSEVWRRVTELAQAVPATPPPRERDDTVVQQASRALGAWQSAPNAPAATGPDAETLRAQIAALPSPPDGDTRADPTVEHLRDAYLQAAALVERDERHRISPPNQAEASLMVATDVGSSDLLSMAERLEHRVVAVDPRLETALDSARAFRDQAAAQLRSAEERESEASGWHAPGRRVTPESRASTERHSPTATGRPTARGGVIPAAGACLLALGVAMLITGRVAAGVALIIAGMAGVAGGLVARSDSKRHEGLSSFDDAATYNERLQAARTELRQAREASLGAERAVLEAEAKLDAARRAELAGISARQVAAAEASRRGLPADAATLRDLAREVERATTSRTAFERWQAEYDADRTALEYADARLAESLRKRGYAGSDVLQTCANYERDCEERAKQFRQAERRSELERQLADRVAAAQAAERARRVRAAALQGLIEAASAAGLAAAFDGAGDRCAGRDESEATGDRIAAALQSWLEERAHTLAESDQQREKWQELHALLGGRRVDEVGATAANDLRSAQEAGRQAQRASADVDARHQELAGSAAAAGVDIPASPRDARSLAQSRHEAAALARLRENELAAAAASLCGMVSEREQSIPSVAEAQESVERARREVDRVRSLASVLTLTSDYLERAQDKTYNDLAPVLNAALDKWLPQITGGRYRRARVDPETLEVSVESASGALRRADLLSIGTAEQIYLLLRVALAEHLADKKAVSPLLLDDVTVQADPTRTEAILAMCKALAEEGRQVVLFAQEPTVAAWAEQHLRDDRHSVIRLAVPADV
jgi:DNA repair protein SbcC/Rad50